MKAQVVEILKYLNTENKDEELQRVHKVTVSVII